MLTPAKSPLPRAALVLLAFLAVFWGANWPLLKIAVREAPVFWFRTVCVWGSAAGLFAIAWVGGHSLHVARDERVRLVVVSLLSITAWNALVGFGVLLLPAGRASMLGYTMPLWLALLSHFMIGERLTRSVVAGLALGMAGVALLIGEDAAAFTRVPLGTASMLGGAFAWALGIAIIKRRPFSLTPTAQMAWLMAVGGIPLALLGSQYGGLSTPTLSPAAWFSVVYNVAIAGVLGYWAFYKLVNMLPAAVTGISSLSVPVFGVLTSMLVLGEWPGWREWLALLCIVAALGMVLLIPALAHSSQTVANRPEV
jgi:drug/metabolite transporter (DMT)-like permease